MGMGIGMGMRVADTKRDINTEFLPDMDFDTHVAPS